MFEQSEAAKHFSEVLSLLDVTDANFTAATRNDFKLQKLVELLVREEGCLPDPIYREPVDIGFRVDVNTRLVDLLDDSQIIGGYWRYKNPGKKKILQINIRWIGRSIRSAVDILSASDQVNVNDLTIADLLSVTSSKLLATKGTNTRDIDKLNSWLIAMNLKPLRRC